MEKEEIKEEEEEENEKRISYKMRRWGDMVNILWHNALNKCFGNDDLINQT